MKDKAAGRFPCAAKVGGIVANDRWPAQFLYDNLAIAANVIHAAAATGVEKLLLSWLFLHLSQMAPQPIAESAFSPGRSSPPMNGMPSQKLLGSNSVRLIDANTVATSSRRCPPTSMVRKTISISSPAM